MSDLHNTSVEVVWFLISLKAHRAGKKSIWRVRASFNNTVGWITVTLCLGALHQQRAWYSPRCLKVTQGSCSATGTHRIILMLMRPPSGEDRRTMECVAELRWERHWSPKKNIAGHLQLGRESLNKPEELCLEKVKTAFRVCSVTSRPGRLSVTDGAMRSELSFWRKMSGILCNDRSLWNPKQDKNEGLKKKKNK